MRRGRRATRRGPLPSASCDRNDPAKADRTDSLWWSPVSPQIYRRLRVPVVVVVVIIVQRQRLILRYNMPDHPLPSTIVPRANYIHITAGYTTLYHVHHYMHIHTCNIYTDLTIPQHTEPY